MVLQSLLHSFTHGSSEFSMTQLRFSVSIGFLFFIVFLAEMLNEKTKLINEKGTWKTVFKSKKRLFGWLVRQFELTNVPITLH